MSKVYLWERPKKYTEEEIGIYHEANSPDRFLFMQGMHLSNKQIGTKPIIKFDLTIQELEQYDCLISTASIPIVNKRLADLLRTYAAYDIQLFDVKIECPDGELKGYKILNACHIIKGIDHDQSVYTRMKMGDFILSFKRLFYKPGCMHKHLIARDADYKTHLLVNEALHDILQNQNLIGMRLVVPEEYYGN